LDSRGKKVYRRFDDLEDEDEEISDSDVGLLAHADSRAPRARPLRTLTRKSIKPTRLFETEQQKKLRMEQSEEEAVTDLEDVEDSDAADESIKIKRGKAGKKSSPFDTWPRLKKGSRDVSSSKASKRSASDALDDFPGAEASRSASKRKTRA
jgi:hypothetical protein